MLRLTGFNNSPIAQFEIFKRLIFDFPQAFRAVIRFIINTLHKLYKAFIVYGVYAFPELYSTNFSQLISPLLKQKLSINSFVNLLII